MIAPWFCKRRVYLCLKDLTWSCMRHPYPCLRHSMVIFPSYGAWRHFSLHILASDRLNYLRSAPCLVRLFEGSFWLSVQCGPLKIVLVAFGNASPKLYIFSSFLNVGLSGVVILIEGRIISTSRILFSTAAKIRCSLSVSTLLSTWMKFYFVLR